MLTGIEIVIERMKTHPEEFTREGKWVELLVSIDAHLTEDERQSLKQGFSDAAREKFNELVLKSIANEGIEWYEVQSLKTTYEGVMSYPMEKKRMQEEEEKRDYEYQLATTAKEAEIMRMQRRAMQSPAAQQSAYGNGLLGNQVPPWR